MNVSEFRSLSRGDLVEVEGNGAAVVETCYVKNIEGNSKTFVDIRLRNGEVIPALSEYDASIFRFVHSTELEAA